MAFQKQICCVGKGATTTKSQQASLCCNEAVIYLLNTQNVLVDRSLGEKSGAGVILLLLMASIAACDHAKLLLPAFCLSSQKGRPSHPSFSCWVSLLKANPISTCSGAPAYHSCYSEKMPELVAGWLSNSEATNWQIRFCRTFLCFPGHPSWILAEKQCRHVELHQPQTSFLSNNFRLLSFAS